MIAPRTEVIVALADEPVAVLVVEPGEYVIGSEAGCEIVAAVAGVAPRHARLTVRFEEMLIEVLGSAQGTAVNGEKLTGPVRLWPGQRVQLGAATLTTRRLRSEEAGESLLPWAAELRRQLPEELRREGRYAINSLVAQGGMGAILDARDQTIRRTVAMKVMLDPRFQDDMVRFIEEAQVTGQLEHPNIVPIYELGVDAHEQVFYTMKFVRGITLKQVLERIATGAADVVRKYPLAPLLTVFQKVCDAVAFAHSRGVIHRDLKPENVMIGDFGEVLVMDWGLAKMLRSQDEKPELVRVPRSDAAPIIKSARLDSGELGATLAGTVLGTPNFMSPEQAEGRVADLDARSDIFALGGILYSILTLEMPFIGDTVEEILEKVVSGKITPPTRPKKLPPRHQDAEEIQTASAPFPALAPLRLRESHLPSGRVPDSLSAVAMKALATQPAGRYQTVPEFQKDIEAYQGGFATSAERAGAWRQIALLVKRHQAASLGLAAVVLVGAIFGTQALLQGRRAERMLSELRGTAPTFEAQSRALLAEGKLEDALAKIGYAVDLAPENPEYHLARAHLLQSTLQLGKAAQEYRRVLALQTGNAPATTNLALCEKLFVEKGGARELPVDLQSKLLDALAAQHRDLEAAPLSKRLNLDSKTAEATIRARLAVYVTQKGWNAGRIRRAGRGFFVDLTSLQVGDLNALHDLPITELSLAWTAVSDLRPLAGLQLEILNLRHTRATDLAPLRGMPLRRLDLGDSDVSDLSPLSGLPLRELELASAQKVDDLTPLAGLPLETLNLSWVTVTDLRALHGMPLRTLLLHRDEQRTADFSPLAHSPTLEKLSLPSQISDIGFLSTLPRLEQVEFHNGNDSERWIPARDFLATYGPEVPEIKAARAALAVAGLKNLPISKVSVDAQHGLRLDLSRTAIADLKHLRGLPIARLDLSRTAVRDLEPLRGMPLRELWLYVTKISDLQPLRGAPLVGLYLAQTSVRDVGLLANFAELHSLEVPEGASNVERVRTLPKLRYLSTRWDDNLQRPAQTVEEFWREFDAKSAGSER